MTERFKLINPNDADPSKRGGGLDPDFVAGLQANLLAAREQSQAGVQAELADALATGRLGYQPKDLELPAPAGGNVTRNEQASSALSDVQSAYLIKQPPVGWQDSRRRPSLSNAGVSTGERVGPLSTAELDTIMMQRAPGEADGAQPAADRQIPKRRIYVEGADGQPLSSEEWEDRRTAASAESNTPSFVQGHQEYMSAQTEQRRADDEFLASFPKGFVDDAVEEYGREFTLAALRGHAEFPSKIAERGEAQFTHASTGEKMSINEVRERMSQVEAARIGQDISHAAELATTKKPFHEEIIDAENGLVHREVGHLDDSLAMVIETNQDGTLGRVEVIATDRKEDGTSEAHTVDVVEPYSDEPEILIDNQPAMQDEAPIVEAVIAEVQKVSSADEAKADVAGEAVEAEQDPQPAPEPEQAPEKPAEVGNTVPDATPKVTPEASATPPMQPPAAERTQRSFDAKLAANAAFEAAQHYIANQAVRSLLERAGIDVKALEERAEAGELSISPEAYNAMRNLVHDASPRSMIWEQTPGNGSTLQRAAGEIQNQFIAILRSL